MIRENSARIELCAECSPYAAVGCGSRGAASKKSSANPVQRGSRVNRLVKNKQEKDRASPGSP
jgi:hypothetical protein